MMQQESAGLATALDVLQREEARLVEALRRGSDHDEEARLLLSDLKRAVAWLARIEELGLGPASRYDILPIPDLPDAFASYRIMDDCDSDDREDWRELSEGLIIAGGDFIISRKG
ncbi:MAG: hypothetical protein CSA97_04795 [Bacteroidetes bacterium]|nr:MAG: hypothetical protein CSA97_04795 [Bacteroidota bacterium]